MAIGSELLPGRPGFLQRLRPVLTPWLGLSLLVIFLVTLPILTIIFQVGGSLAETLSYYAGNRLLGIYLGNSLILTIAVASLAALIGVGCAATVAYYDFPGRSIFSWMLVLPLALPGYISAYTYAGLCDYFGPLQTFLNHFTTWQIKESLMTIEGAIFILSMALFPYVYLFTRVAISRQSVVFLEASRMLGNTFGNSFLRIGIPMARPAIIGGLMLVIMETLNDYGVVEYFGVPTLTNGIFRTWFAMNNPDGAIRLSALLMLLTFVFVLAEYLLRRQSRFASASAAYRPLQRRLLKGWKAAAAILICLTPLAAGFLIPVSQLLVWGAATIAVIGDSSYLALLGNSILLAGGSAVLVTLAALLIVYGARLNRSAGVKLISRLAVLGYSIPGVVIAVGVLTPVIWLDYRLNDIFQYQSLLLSGTVAVVVFGYLVRFLALSFNSVEAGFEQSCHNLDEASRSLGCPPLQTLLKINIPLIKGALLAAAMLVFIDVLKELPLTLFLSPANFETLATKTYEMAAKDEALAQSANIALLIVAAGIWPVFRLNKMMGGE